MQLLRKGSFKQIVCIDADPGPGDAGSSISEAIDLAALETGARVNMNLDPLRANVNQSRAPAYSTRSVTVGIVEHSDGSLGLLWYAKPSLSEEMPAILLAFRETHPDFPRLSTLNQFFDTSTYIASRNLGRYNARILRHARGVLKEAMTNKSGDAIDWGDFARVDETTHWVHREVAELIENRWHDIADVAGPSTGSAARCGPE